MRVLAPASLSVNIGEQVGLHVDRTRLHVFDAASGDRLN